MNRTLKRISAPAALALSVGISAEYLGQRAFSRLVRRDVGALYARTATGRAGVVTDEMLSGLPAPVRRCFVQTGMVGRPFVRTVHLRHKGRMQPGAGLPWMPIDAEEHYSVDPPGFVWDGTVHLGPIPLVRARDMYLDGRGGMLVKVASLVTLVDAGGAGMDQASMTRYLSEMIWFPTAFLGDNVSWDAVDDRSARVTLTDRGRSVTGTMHFDGEGRLTDFVAQRSRTAGESVELATWSTSITAYGEFEGLRLPARGRAVWKLAEGDMEYIDVAITELRYGF